ncbi:hypothetical protein Hanom_Chr10g00884401 [Helianthus anomalus]
MWLTNIQPNRDNFIHTTHTFGLVSTQTKQELFHKTLFLLFSFFLSFFFF